MEFPIAADDWVALTKDPLDQGRAARWAVLASCGAVVTFAGTVRDHSEGREGVSVLEYEAYQEQVEPRLRAIAAVARERWPMIGRLVLWHRIGRLVLGEESVVVVASAPHRPEAFEAAKFLIDAIKLSVPIWKKETWSEGTDWSLCDHEIEHFGISSDERDLLVDEISRRSLDSPAPIQIAADRDS
ncbi:MAG TPA: molybdenum cofactor biosynthesis protein MoaE [Acidimicrobiales bacterium]|nr:molybdenum cofactor biosynthesis protein MoaE [Acidimicrobiales bacterium]